MAKTKRINFLRTLLCIAFMSSMIVGIFGLFTKETTVYAATTPRYKLAYDYVHYYNYNTGKSADASGNDTYSVNVKGNNGSNTSVSFSIYGTATSGTGNLPKGGAIASDSLTITIDTGFRSYSMSVKNSAGKVVGSQSGNNYKLSGLSDGKYTFTCSLSGTGWNPNPRAYAWYSMNVTSSFVVDTTAPTINNASTSSTGKYTSSSTYISASDSGSGVSALYMKTPNSNSYSSIGTTTTISNTMVNGLYSFYAKDKAGNISSTYYLYLDTVAPTGTIKNSNGTVLTGNYTNQAFSYSATDNGSGVSYLQYKTPNSSSWQTYNSGTVISESSTSGTYQFRAVDKAGNISATKNIAFDSAKPTMTLYSGTTVVSNGYKSTEQYIKAMATDSGSGIKAIYVKKPNSSSFAEYTSGTQLTEDGAYSFYSVDNAGNI